MFAEERKGQIITMLNRRQRVSVQELTEHFGVSESTIRRDLHELEQEHQLKRTHGGAIAFELGRSEPSYVDKQEIRHKEKLTIARYAATLIEPGETILLDAGTTTTLLAEQLRGRSHLTVVTNAYNIAGTLSTEKDIEVVLIGGMVKFNTLAAVGPYAEMVLRQINADKLFLGANGVDVRRGVTTPDVLEAQTKQSMIYAAHDIILLADSSKMSRSAFAHVCSLDDIDRFVTDSGIDERVKRELLEKQVRLDIVDEGGSLAG